MDIHVLEHILDDSPEEMKQQIIGMQVELAGQQLTITKLDNGRIALEKIFPCTVCGENNYTGYIGRGAPGWCYLLDKSGCVVADLRQQVYVCLECRDSLVQVLKTVFVIILPAKKRSRYPAPPSGGKERWN
jgi:hypothetical protein